MWESASVGGCELLLDLEALVLPVAGASCVRLFASECRRTKACEREVCDCVQLSVLERLCAHFMVASVSGSAAMPQCRVWQAR